MTVFLTVTHYPVQLNEELAAALVGLTVRVRPEILTWTEGHAALEPGPSHYWLYNDDIVTVLTRKLGIAEALRYAPHLPTGCVTAIQRVCCEIIRATETHPA